ncbi:hypothetical protein PR202_ga09433 [Eleusine coracana subsp. coracana]|uniref:ferroxidase n=1 Tax=Eleusine coracana subsp. coracana TaxID=191504 RepID=A0AAV5C2Z5_ELECO|nr:hypothetical protein PR202_ga09433 [Eleusine coracana subsp. coracana]
MASRKLLLSIAAGRGRIQHRATSQLFWVANLPEATASRSLVAAAALTKPSGESPSAALLFASRTISSTIVAKRPAGDAPGPTSSEHKKLMSCYLSAMNRLIMPEGEFHKLADETIHDLLEKLEEYGDSVQMDGFDIDYGNQVLTLRLGDLGTYVVNKQAPNRQIWLSSPVSGPSRFDWDAETSSWVYKRTGAKLEQLLEKRSVNFVALQ